MESTKENERIQIALYNDTYHLADTNFKEALFGLNNEIELLSNNADKYDYLIAIGSGVMASLLDIFWVTEFDFKEGKEFADAQIESFVIKVAKTLGCKSDDINACVRYLEKKFPIPSDGNTPEFGGGLQHHLRDFGHHPTLLGLIFSLLTQFTGKSFGTDTLGVFKIYDVPLKSKAFIGSDLQSKIMNGTLVWFAHLISDIAGSSNSAAYSGGTGIPGPLLALAKEISTLPIIKEIKIQGYSLSSILSKLFNGTLFAQYNADGSIIKESVHKFDFRGEIGVAQQILKQSTSVVVNECLVRFFYFIRRLALEVKEKEITDFKAVKSINWDNVKPYANPTIQRMLTLASAVFTSIDVSHAIVSKKGFIAVNYVGIGRFGVALGTETMQLLKTHNTKRMKKMYEEISLNTFSKDEYDIYKESINKVTLDNLGLTILQTEILYNLQFHKTLNDILKSKSLLHSESVVALKLEWLNEWKQYMSLGFPSFVQDDNAKLNWYPLDELKAIILENNPSGTWLRLVLFEAMLFEPYYTISVEKKKDKERPSKKYSKLNALNGYNRKLGDEYLQNILDVGLCPEGYIKRLRACYNSILRELKEVLKSTLTGITIAAGIALLLAATAGMAAPKIATILVGSKFAGLSGAALTSASLAYLGGGAVAVGGLGMAGGTSVIVAGGSILGIGLGSGVGLSIGATQLIGKKNTILQSAKLMVVLREIFLNDEKDLSFSDIIMEEYTNRIIDLEGEITHQKLKADVAQKSDKKELLTEIKLLEETVDSMKLARKSMNIYVSSFKVGMETYEK